MDNKKTGGIAAGIAAIVLIICSLFHEGVVLPWVVKQRKPKCQLVR